MNVISFSLYGSLPKYCIGAIRNAELAKRFFPDWQMVLWYDETVPLDVLKALMVRGSSLRQADSQRYPNGMFWRMLSYDEPGVERILIRDCDSRLSQREKGLIDAWVESGKGLHTIRDHPYHIMLLMGGLTGMRTGRIPSMAELLEPFAQNTKRGTDEQFLIEKVHPFYASDFLQHDSCLTGNHSATRIYPDKEDPFPFLGEIMDENDQPNQGHRSIRTKHLRIR